MTTNLTSANYINGVLDHNDITVMMNKDSDDDNDNDVCRNGIDDPLISKNHISVLTLILIKNVMTLILMKNVLTLI
jgi:hypothetical protein